MKKYFILILTAAISTSVSAQILQNNDTDVTLITLVYQNQSSLDSTLYAEVEHELALARSLEDTFESMHVETLSLSIANDLNVVVPVSWTRESWYLQDLEIGDNYLDSLDGVWGLNGVSRTIGHPDWYSLEFDHMFNPLFASAEFMNSPRVKQADYPNPVIVLPYDQTYQLDFDQHDDMWCFIFHSPINIASFPDSIHCWFVTVVGEEAQVVDERTVSLSHNPEEVMPFNFPTYAGANIYPDLDSLLMDLSNDSTWWVQENSLYSIVELVYSFFYSVEMGESSAEGSWTNAFQKELMNRHVKVPPLTSPAECLLRGMSVRPTRTTSDISELRVEFVNRMLEVEDAVIQVAAQSPDSSNRTLAGAVQALMELDWDYPGTGRYPDNFIVENGEHELFFDSYSDTLSWSDAFPQDSAGTFQYEITGYLGNWEYPLPNPPLYLSQPYVTIGELYDALGWKPEVLYHVKISALRREGPPLIGVAGNVDVVLTHMPVPMPFQLVAPADSIVADWVPEEKITFSWSSATPAGAEVKDEYMFQYGFPNHEYSSDVIYVGTDTFLTVEPDGWTWGVVPAEISWRVIALDNADSRYYSDLRYILYHTIDAPEQDSSTPRRFEISETYPNPFNPTLTAVVALPMRAQLKLEVFNLLGQRVATLSDGVQEAGWRHFIFDGTNLASGVYLLRASVPGKLEQVRKITLVR